MKRVMSGVYYDLHRIVYNNIHTNKLKDSLSFYDITSNHDRFIFYDIISIIDTTSHEAKKASLIH